MTTIEFSLIPDADYETVSRWMMQLKRETDIDVQLQRMDWDDAWSQLINIATQGQDS